jgi:hypothetical protein
MPGAVAYHKCGRREGLLLPAAAFKFAASNLNTSRQPLPPAAALVAWAQAASTATEQGGGC